MKDTFDFEGKKYISSRRASEISDYSSDYIGQLCRAQKLDCRMVGRSWFVTENSLTSHKEKMLQDEVVRNRIENLKGKKVVSAYTSSIPSTKSETNTIGVNTTQNATTINNEGLKYESDDRPLLPTPIVSTIIEEAEEALLVEEALPFNIEQDTEGSSPIITNKYFIPRSAAVSFIAVFVLVAGLAFSYFIIGSNSMRVSNNDNQAGVFASVGEFVGSITKGVRNIIAKISGKPVALNNNSLNSNTLNTESVSEGMVVVPHTGISDEDNASKDKILRSFSDMVEVRSDDTGNAGVITPVFRESKGEDFMYVMVPVKEKVTESP